MVKLSSLKFKTHRFLIEADDLPGKEWSDEELEEQRLKNIRNMFRSQGNVKIGCCNGLPYNSSKRCCCRRIPFDKDKKFCCAIDVSTINIPACRTN